MGSGRSRALMAEEVVREVLLHVMMVRCLECQRAVSLLRNACSVQAGVTDSVLCWGQRSQVGSRVSVYSCQGMVAWQDQRRPTVQCQDRIVLVRSERMNRDQREGWATSVHRGPMAR